MTIDQDVKTIISCLTSRGKGNVSFRLEKPDPFQSEIHNGEYYSDVLSSVARHFFESGDIRIAILAIPLRVTKEVCLDAPEDFDVDLDALDAPIFYLHCDYDFFIEANEEYRKVIPSKGNLRSAYRSWRGEEAAENDWEFENHIFIWAPLPQAN